MPTLLLVAATMGVWWSFPASAQSPLESRLSLIEQRLDRLEGSVRRSIRGGGSPSFFEGLIRRQACDGDLLDKEFFVICYDRNWKVAKWVGYHLNESKLRGSTDRTDDFRPDQELPPVTRSNLSDYRNSGFDRGHMAPAGAFKRSHEAMSTTFLLSNMAPQTARLNRQRWRQLENQIRTLARNRGDILVFTGNLFLEDGEPTQPTTRIGDGGVAVPTHNYKVVLLALQNGNIELFGFILPNQRERIEPQVVDFLRSVDAVELVTQIDFFAFLDDEIEEELENQPAPWVLDRQ